MEPGGGQGQARLRTLQLPGFPALPRVDVISLRQRPLSLKVVLEKPLVGAHCPSPQPHQHILHEGSLGGLPACVYVCVRSQWIVDVERRGVGVCARACV